MSGKDVLLEAVTAELAPLGVGPIRLAGMTQRIEQTLTDLGYYVAPITPATTVGARATDPRTSHKAAEVIRLKAGTQRHRLLEAFARDSLVGNGTGLTDEEAMEQTVGVSPTSEYATRCSEMRRAGWLVDTGEDRKGNSGTPRIVSRITEKGLAELRRVNS